MFFPLLSPHKNTKSLQDYIASHPARFTDDVTQATAILVAGGDGFMLHSIKLYHQHQLPFIGVNFWTVGFLMNHIDTYDLLPDDIAQYTLIQQTLPSVTMHDDTGNTHHCHAINDIIIGKNLIDYFHFDIHSDSINKTIKGTGLILSTPIGSSAYRYKNGWPIIDLDSNTRGLMGIATLPFHHTQITPQTITIAINGKKPADIGIDGYSGLHTNIIKLIIKTSPQIISLAFLPDQNLHHKRQLLQ